MDTLLQGGPLSKLTLNLIKTVNKV